MVFSLFAWVVSFGAQAAGSVQFTFGTGWVTGSVTGLTAPWPFSFKLSGSFSENSTATILFDDAGIPTLTVSDINPAGSRYFSFDFGTGTEAPAVQISSGAFVAPTVRTFDASGSVMWAARSDGQAGVSGRLAREIDVASSLPVPEPTALTLMLAGLATLAWRARRLRA